MKSLEIGAIAAGDIGRHFPDTSAEWKDADSRDLLRRCLAFVHEKGFKVGNLDCTIMAQAPKMAPHIAAMQACIAQDLELDVTCVNVKATTTEKLGFVGRKEGIAVEAVVLLMKV